MVWQIAEDYACASVLLRLPGYSPMPAFGEVIDVPLVVRHAQKSKAQVRTSYLGMSCSVLASRCSCQNNDSIISQSTSAVHDTQCTLLLCDDLLLDLLPKAYTNIDLVLCKTM